MFPVLFGSAPKAVKKPPDPNPVIVFDGTSSTFGIGASDSVTPGVGTSWGSPNYVGRTLARLVSGSAPVSQSNLTVYNTGRWQGGFTQDCIDGFAATVTPKLLSSTKNIVILHGGMGTDIRNNLTGAQSYAKLQAYAALARAPGPYAPTKFIVVLPQDAVKVDNQAFYDTERANLRTLVLADGTTYADGVVDWFTDSRLGVAGARNDATYFNADLIHQTDAGYNVEGWYAAPVVQNVLNPLFPLTLPSLKLWWKADRGRCQDSAITTVASANNDPTGSWSDQACVLRDTNGRLHALAQATAGMRPLVKTGAKNLKPSLVFDGVDDWLQTAALASALAQPLTVYIVYKSVAIGASSTHDIIYVGNNSDLVNLIADTTPRTVWSASGGLVYNANICNGTFGVIGVNYNNGGTSTLRSNGAQVQSGVTGAQTANLITLAASTAGSRSTNIEVLEVLVCGATLAGADLSGLESYLNSEYAVY
jgi:hypothetical protein